MAAHGAAANTLLLFTSDNGPSLRWGVGAGNAGIFPGRAAASAPMARATCTAKGSTWEGSVRSAANSNPGTPPCTSEAGVRWQACRRLCTGRAWSRPAASRTVISSLDVLPSPCARRLPPPPDRVLDGATSLADAILDPRARRRATPSSRCTTTLRATRRDTSSRRASELQERPALLDDSDGPTSATTRWLGAGSARPRPAPAGRPRDRGSKRAVATFEHQARFGRYKLHWVTSPGLTPQGLSHPAPALRTSRRSSSTSGRPVGAFPLAPSATPPRCWTRRRQGAYEGRLAPTSIDLSWGYEYALCCGVDTPHRRSRASATATTCSCHGVEGCARSRESMPVYRTLSVLRCRLTTHVGSQSQEPPCAQSAASREPGVARQLQSAAPVSSRARGAQTARTSSRSVSGVSDAWRSRRPPRTCRPPTRRRRPSSRTERAAPFARAVRSAWRLPARPPPQRAPDRGSWRAPSRER